MNIVAQDYILNFLKENELDINDVSNFGITSNGGRYKLNVFLSNRVGVGVQRVQSKDKLNVSSVLIIVDTFDEMLFRNNLDLTEKFGG